jgi:hypothetical protein
MTDYRLDDRGSIPAKNIHVSLHLDVQIGSGVHSILCPMGNGGSPLGKAAGGVKLATHFHLVPRLRMHGAIPPHSSTSSRCAA